MPREYVEFQVMREMNWTYRELMETPVNVVTDIIRYLNTEAKFQKDQIKRQEMRHGRS